VSIHANPQDVATRRRLGGPVVVGVDPGVPSASSLQWAAAEAYDSASPLHLVTALSASVQVPELAEQVQRRLAAQARALDVEDSSNRIVHGTPSQVLLDECADARLLVVGRRPFGDSPHLLAGHTSTDVAAAAPVPVVVVPEQRFTPRRDLAPIIALIEPAQPAFPASPLADPARQVLGFAFDRAATAGVPLIVISIEELQETTFGSPSGNTTALARRLEPWQRLWPKVEVVSRALATPAQAVAGTLLDGSGSAQLVVLGRHSTQRSPGCYLGQTARVLVRNSSNPVAIVPVAPEVEE